MAEEISKLRFRRGQLKATVKRIQKYLVSVHEQDVDNKTIYEVKARLDKLISVNQKFEEIQTNIEMLVDDDENIQLQEEQHRVEFEELFYKLCAEMQEVINMADSSEAQSSGSQDVQRPQNNRINYPIINLPTFDGQYQNWIPFRDSFKSLIHDQNCLTKIEKFHYLKSSLKGEAASLLDSIKISEDNYQLAFDTLTDRFENKKRLINSHIKSITQFPNIQKDSVGELRKLIDTVKRNLAILKNLGLDIANWDTLVLHIIENKLDESTRREWEAKTVSKDSPTLQDFYDVISQRCEYLEAIGSKKQSSPSEIVNPSKCSNKTNSKFRKSTTVETFIATQHKKECPHCSGQHPLFFCKTFLEMPIATRQKLVKELNICFNCLKSHHTSKVCISGGCKKCGKKHNTLLHADIKEFKPVENSTETQETRVVSTITSAHGLSNTEVLLSTAIINVIDNKGKKHPARALLDSGSQGNFLSKEFFYKLTMSPQKIHQSVAGINQMSMEITEGAELEIQSQANSWRTKSKFLLINKITDYLPQRPIEIQQLQIPNNVVLADPKFSRPGKIDMLIGAPLFWELLCIGQIRLNNNRLIMQKTRLGWIISGSIPVKQKLTSKSLICNFLSMEERIEKFWNLEEINSHLLSKEEQEFENNFKRTVRRREDGRFEVGLPLNSKIEHLGESYSMAEKRFLSLEKRLNKSPEMKEKYQEFITEYENLGHMTKIPTTESEPNPVYYLPHHGIFKEGNITTKLRVVFDGSAKTNTGISLNDVLLGGSQLQNDLFSILLRFRKHSIVITSDIEKMYRQVYIHTQDRELQRILWRNSIEEPISKYRLNTVTYGTKCGSFLAIRCLQEVANQIQQEHPEVSKIISQDFYVDDLLTGGESVPEILQLRSLITQKLAEFGFNLRKWNSNHESVVQEIKQGKMELKHLVIEDSISKTLGLLWDARKDTLQYSVQESSKKICTKRTVISAIAQIFDPLGLIGPVTTVAKILMQDLWRQKLDWDESLSQEMFTRWQQFQLNWGNIKHLEIPRQVLVRKATTIHIHGFCDASESAYGACFYVSSTNESGEQMVKLLCAKSRVAPLKKISLPKLELCGALILSKLLKTVLNSMQISCHQIFLWTDSNIVLAWLSKEPIHWKTFVANRVTEIQHLTKEYQWRHINGKENPADIISRGMNAKQLISNPLWWNGPIWLKKPISEWPLQDIIDNEFEIPEARKSSILSCTINFKSDLIYKYSNFQKLKRIIAYILRFLHNTKRENQKRTGPLSFHELEEALFKIVKLVQAEVFSKEILLLKSGKSISNKCKLKSLNPILDNKGILRVGGRLSNSSLDYEEKHQMIMPNSHFVTELIIKNEHHKQLHAGVQTLLSSLRLKFWIIGGRNVIKKYLRKCTTCIKAKPKFFEHQMGDLPKDRITPTFPFQICGVDYAGPIEIRNNRLRNSKILKAYICIFVCFVTKAVHIELAVDLTTDSFINALKRFISRRGKPSKIYSDNATNFIGAKNKLINFEKITEAASKEEITWKLIPPRAPHFGGLWEAAVKSAKHHLTKTIGSTRLTYEELYTLLVQIESCLNSRPITPISSDPKDLNPLTPSHFLIGRHMQAITEESLLEEKIHHLNRYQLITKIFQDFWARWSKEYLHSLQQRSKWQLRSQEQPQVGDLVIIKEPGILPLQWKLGRVTKIYPGKDGTIRVVDLTTTGGTITRSIRHICKLPTQ